MYGWKIFNYMENFNCFYKCISTTCISQMSEPNSIFLMIYFLWYIRFDGIADVNIVVMNENNQIILCKLISAQSYMYNCKGISIIQV